MNVKSSYHVHIFKSKIQRKKLRRTVIKVNIISNFALTPIEPYPCLHLSKKGTYSNWIHFNFRSFLSVFEIVRENSQPMSLQQTIFVQK